jgi:hypothetical protein
VRQRASDEARDFDVQILTARRRLVKLQPLNLGRLRYAVAGRGAGRGGRGEKGGRPGIRILRGQRARALLRSPRATPSCGTPSLGLSLLPPCSHHTLQRFSCVLRLLPDSTCCSVPSESSSIVASSTSLARPPALAPERCEIEYIVPSVLLVLPPLHATSRSYSSRLLRMRTLRRPIPNFHRLLVITYPAAYRPLVARFQAPGSTYSRVSRSRMSGSATSC